MNNVDIKTQPGKALVIAVCLIGFGVLGNWYLVQVQPLEAPNPYQSLYEELLYPSIQIHAGYSTGSGVVISSTNKATYILSAAHVVGDEGTIDVTFYYPGGNSTTITGSVLATDTLKDLALIKAYTYKTFPYVARLARRGYKVHVFQPVWVIGCSLGYPPRPTSGEVTAINQYYEINAPIWPGNSGGGVFLKDTHELIGIAILVKVYQGQLVSTMGSIVPLEDIYEFIDSHALRVTGPAVTHELVNSYKGLKGETTRVMKYPVLIPKGISPAKAGFARDISDCNSLCSNSH